MNSASANFTAISVVLLALCLLQAGVDAGALSQLTFASPTEIAKSIPMLLDEQLLRRFGQTFGEALLATAIAALVGLPIAFTFAARPILDLAFRGWVAVLASAPLILLYPLFLVTFGRNAGTIIAIGTLSALPPIILNARDGLKQIKPVLVEVGLGFGMSSRDMIWKVLLPAATPAIVTGLRLAVIFALANVVAVEFVINFGGLGYLVGEMSDRYEIPAMYGAISTIVAVSAIFHVATGRLEKWLRPY